jgi:hypothetical protein
MRDTIQDAAFFNDPRNRGSQVDELKVWVMDEDTSEREVVIPTKWVLCDLCEGTGTHVNPAIDCNGLTAEDFYDDPDFAEDYRNGVYDVTCNRCCGRTTIRVPDYDSMTERDREALRQHQEAEAEMRAERLAEIRMGC